MRKTDVLIVGAGQAGLALSACLSARSIEHTLIERGRIAERWHAQRWESLRLLTPNWMTRLPGHSYSGPDPHGFMHRDAVIELLSGYARATAAPVVEQARVSRLSAHGQAFLVTTDVGCWSARAVVVATGACHRPAVPCWSRDLDPGLVQVTRRTTAPRAICPMAGSWSSAPRRRDCSLRVRSMPRDGPSRFPWDGIHGCPGATAGGTSCGGSIGPECSTRPGTGFPISAPPGANPRCSFRARPDEADLSLMRLAFEGVRPVGRVEGGAGARIAIRSNLPAPAPTPNGAAGAHLLALMPLRRGLTPMCPLILRPGRNPAIPPAMQPSSTWHRGAYGAWSGPPAIAALTLGYACRRSTATAKLRTGAGSQQCPASMRSACLSCAGAARPLSTAWAATLRSSRR